MPPNKRTLSDNASGLPRRQVISTLLLALALSAVFAGGLWSFYRQARDHLDDTMGLRLQNVAVTAAATVPADSLLSWLLAPAEREPVSVTLLAATLKGVEVDNGLSKIVLYDEQRTVLLDTSRLLQRGEEDPFLILDLPAVEQATFGVPSYSALQDVAGVFLKAGYAPVVDSYGDVAGFVGVVGSAEFFETLRRLRQTLLTLGLIIVGGVVVLSGMYLGYARRLARARAALARSEQLSAMGRMAAGIAHEIRNPLGIIKNTAQLMKEDLVEANVDSDLLDFIPQEVDRLNETLTGYLEFAKDAPLRVESIDVTKLVRRTLKVMRPDFAHAQVELLDNLDELGQLSAQIDPRRMQQVFMNLFLNAIQAMPKGGRLHVELGSGGDRWTAIVRDTGVGVTPEVAANLFEPFVTSKEKGSGLGLSVVRRIVDSHGGEIHMDSTPGQGAAVTMSLPLRGPER